MNNWFWTVFEIFINSIECFIMLGFVHKYLGRRTSKKYQLPLFLLFFGVLLFLEYVYLSIVNIQFLFFMLALFAYAVLCLRGSLAKKLVVSVLAQMFLTVANSLTLFIVKTLVPMPYDQSFEPGMPRLFIMIGSKLLYLSVFIFLLRPSRKNHTLTDKQWLIIGLSFFSADIAMSIILDYIWLESAMASKETLFFMVIVCVWATSILIFILVSQLSRENEIKNQNQLLLQEKEHRERHIASLKNSSREIQHMKHDLSHYLLTVGNLIRSGQEEKALEKCMEIAGKIDTVATLVETGSLAVDLVLAEKIGDSRAKGIVTICAFGTDLSNIHEVDFCTLFCNLFDNAIEHSLTLQPSIRKIQVEISQSRGCVILSVSNRIAESVLENNPQLLSSKKEKDGHGLGHQSARAIAENMGGILKYHEKNSMFIATAVLPLLCLKEDPSVA